MLAVERRSQIEQLIMQNKSVLVLDLAKRFDVTTETIRADLEKLERQGILVRTYGGATLVEENEPEMTLKERETINYEGKHSIGICAAHLIKDGETIFLDASTSSLHVARSIKDKKGITVITNAEKVASELAGCDNIKVISTGGNLTPKNMSYVGRVAEESIRKNYYANKFFFSCRGVNLHRGIMESSEGEAEIKKAMMDCSESAILLCDHKKLGRLGVPVVAGLDRIDYFITDIKLDEEWTDELAKHGVKLITAEKKE
ncbi:MAG: DeoR/GlpR family DNA-binding transcription regulator [Clostridia bacterium]|nr:DeoR/GlpR family DNA-binding transcription regulator [Clostridia bacterium]